MAKARAPARGKLSADLMPMEARSVDVLPEGAAWQYEPKWDGFRCILIRHDAAVELRSKSGEDLTRYFPELVQASLDLRPQAFALDGEIVVPAGRTFSFDDLLQRIHPAQSRIRKLSKETPARFVAFDLLTLNDEVIAKLPLRERRPALERFARHFKASGLFDLSPATSKLSIARKWLMQAAASMA